MLLGHQCKTDAVAADSMNALHFAAQKGHVGVARLLINAGKYPFW